MKKIIAYFLNKHLFTNIIFIAVLIGGVFFWNITQKEELPDMTFDFVRISVAYPGASAGEVEHFVTLPIEKELKSVHGIYSMRSTSSEGMSSIRIELDKEESNRDNIITEIRNMVYSVKLPAEVDELPSIRQFKTSRKAILDIAVFLDDKKYLSVKDRKNLQTYVLALEKRLLSLPQINSINRKGFLQEEIQILLKSDKLIDYRISVNTVMEEIKKSSVRKPAGSLESTKEERVTVDAELNILSEFKNLIVQGGFEGRFTRLSDIALIRDGYEKNNRVIKINGKEAIILNAVKNSSYGILDAVDSVKLEVDRFQKGLAKEEKVKAVILDDESKDVRNRLSIITMNGIIGFILIVLVLFLFLNFKAGFWVALGIPFTFCLTIIMAKLFGYTINNITLSAVIIVMGMIVDDAIVVSENIIRLRSQGVPFFQAALEGAAYVLLPITASILTTIAAFLPLLTFEGRLSMLSDSIPPIVTLMLISSFLESLIILPAHMNLNVPRWLRIIFSLGTILIIEKFFRTGKKKKPGTNDETEKLGHWFNKIEEWYSKKLAVLLKYRLVIIVFFVLFTVCGYVLMTGGMKFMLFPREETTEVFLIAEAPVGTRKYQTAVLAESIEDIIKPYLGREVIGFRTMIGQSRHRGSRENKLTLRIEVVPADKREMSLNRLIQEWEQKIAEVKGFTSTRFSRHWFGSDSGSAIEVIVHENDNKKRRETANIIKQELAKISGITNIEIDEPYQTPEYKVTLNRDLVRRLGVTASDIGVTLRTILEGSILFKLLDGEEEKNVRITFSDYIKKDINKVLKVPVRNQSDYLVPLSDIIYLKKINTPSEIQRLDYQRTLKVLADFNEKSGKTPLDIAEYLEKEVFPHIISQSPSTNFSYEGEIKMTKESKGFFEWAVIIVLFVIYIILAVQFNSLTKPFIIMLAIIPAVASVIFVFWLHGMNYYGFFGVIGALGLSGVIVNDSIILLNKLEDIYTEFTDRVSSNKEIALIASTRLRAVLLTTITTVVGIIPTAYGFAGYDSMLAEMMLALAWGLVFGTPITLILIPAVYSFEKEIFCGVSQFWKD